MFKLLKEFRKIDWIFMILIIGLTVVQVWCTMMMTDYMSGIIYSITYLNYQKHPETIPQLYSVYTALGSDWNKVMEVATSNPSFSALVPTLSLIANASSKDIWFNGGMMLAVISGNVACQMANALLASEIAASFATNVRRKIVNKVTSFSLSEINHFSTASLITRTTNDIEQVQMTYLMIMRMFFSAPITAIWAICKIQASSTQLTLLTAAFILFLLICLTILVIIVLPKFKISQRYIDKLNGISRESLTGIRVVHAYNAENYQERKFDDSNSDLKKLNLFTGHALGLINPLLIIVMDGVTLGIYWLGASLMDKGEISYATISSFAMLASQIVMAFLTLLMMFVLLPRASVSANRINEVLDMKNSINDPEVEEKPKEKGTIEFKNVSFAYPNSDSNVLEHISFRANKGETIAIIGATGSGKTTLINLIERLYDVSSGAVLVDGVNVKNYNQETLHNLIGYVPQRGNLFKGTVTSNIAFGKKEIDSNKVKEAAEIACADEFIQKMEKGYDSEISQGGNNVSGGQRQRLCIARAIYNESEIYIFDDSFSALDFKTDLQVRTNLKEKKTDATKVIVAQRIGTIMDADLIIVLENGKAVGKGTHKELLENCQTYRAIALSQLSKEELGL